MRVARHILNRAGEHGGIEIRLYRKGTYILADIHGMDHFCTTLAPQPYNKPRSCVSVKVVQFRRTTDLGPQFSAVN
jgi:hypothetical protein